MQRYVCTVCGYIYDPAEGDPDNGIAPGTSFEDLPDDWSAPFVLWKRICSSPKNKFQSAL